jgi:endonuclease
MGTGDESTNLSRHGDNGMKDAYRVWLVEQGYTEKTIATRISDAQRVERLYGDLDDLIQKGGYDSLIGELSYSTEDERRGRANPSKLETEGNIRTNLASYKGAVALYRRFLAESQQITNTLSETLKSVVPADNAANEMATLEKQRLSLERDMQIALRRDITRLESDLRIIDDSAERYVTSGFIDILCVDGEDRVVVVELKAGKSDPRVIAQTLGYMGDLMDEDALQSVRGIIVAHDFDVRTRSAARAVPTLTLYTYAVTFAFHPVAHS